MNIGQETVNSEIYFEKSKTGDLTCLLNGKYLHSKYDPKTEGERFVQNITADFSPFCILVIEPALSYCAEYLKQKFPDAFLCAIRFRKEFNSTDYLWDKVIYFYDWSDNCSFSEVLFNTLGEEKLMSILALDWNGTKQIFQNENKIIWEELKNAVLKARDVLGTRAFFSKRWLKNSVSFTLHAKNTYLIKNINSPVLIAASGPSLASSIPFIKNFRRKFFLIALSSAFMPLIKNEIKPDLIISTDGGYWAKKHLHFSNYDNSVFFALEGEGMVPKELFENAKIIPLVYEDGLEKDLFNSIALPYLISERNGTVAGTALCLARTLTKNNIYLCGFDQAPSPQFQHTQPNSLEIDNSKTDFRLKNAETRITSSRFRSEKSLEIYRKWFISNSGYFSNQVSRLSDNYNYEFNLGKIRESNWSDFEKKESNTKTNSSEFIEKKVSVSESERKSIILKKLDELSTDQKFINEVFPMDSILIRRELSEIKKIELKTALGEKIKKLLEECKKL